MQTPQISVLMGVYYRRGDTALLRRSVESILAQSFSDFELLICDDGSSEAARALLEEYAARDARVRLIRPGGAQRLPVKLNACLREARGELIARMDDDDFSHADRFEKQRAALLDRPEIAFVGCNVALCDASGQLGTRRFPERPEVRDFYMTQPYIHPALLFRRSALDAVGGYCEKPYCDLCEDYDLLLRLYARGFAGMNLQETLLDYTVPTVRGNRRMRHRWREVETRFLRYCELGVLGRALPYVFKPIAVGLLPERALARIKNRRDQIGT